MRDNEKARPSAATLRRAEDKLAFCETMPSTAQSTTAAPSGQRSIADLLGVGRENAMPRRDLERLTGLDGRSVRLLIERERRAGTPILADNASGYYLPASDTERAACVRSLRHRAGEIMATARALELAGLDGGQMEIDEEGR